MAEDHRPKHYFLGQFFRFRFDHQYTSGGAGNDEVELRTRHLAQCRVQNVVSVDVSDARAADGSQEWYPGDRQSGGGADHRHDVGIVFEIVAQNGTDDLGFIDKPGNKERSQWPVDQPRDQRLLLRGASLALEEPARDLAGGKGLLLIVDRWKEVLTGLGGLHRDGSAQHGGLAIGGKHRTIGLARELARLEDERASAPYQLLTRNLKHSRSSFSEQSDAAARFR